MKRHRRIQIKNRTIHHLAAGLFTALVLISCLPATVAAAEPPLTVVERAAHFEESLLRAKATGLLADVPGEAELTPALWGEWEFVPAK